ncbi:predicted protein [Histoplasma capsulatum var. duboisii H88]|uniref:Predicted protein n=2 Tax=Ajellomyces capsulatus TaxID=5037 RepID=F0UTH7_AJEC8|nr:predicted protein [Histoplasma capsulatum H143]EGC49204.1 predicted protein [Histoplasma capsulatum var. duboisii H88]
MNSGLQSIRAVETRMHHRALEPARWLSRFERAASQSWTAIDLSPSGRALTPTAGTEHLPDPKEWFTSRPTNLTVGSSCVLCRLDRSAGNPSVNSPLFAAKMPVEVPVRGRNNLSRPEEPVQAGFQVDNTEFSTFR